MCRVSQYHWQPCICRIPSTVIKVLSQLTSLAIYLEGIRKGDCRLWLVYLKKWILCAQNNVILMILRPKEIVIAIHLFLYIFWNLFIPFPYQQSFLLQCQLSHCPASTSFVLLGYGNSPYQVWRFKLEYYRLFKCEILAVI